MRLYKGGPLSAIWYLFLMGSLMIIMFLLLMSIRCETVQKEEDSPPEQEECEMVCIMPPDALYYKLDR